MSTATKQLTLTIPVKDGELNPSFNQSQSMTGYLHSRNGQAVVVKFSRPVTRRSLNQNRLYWGVYLEVLAEHTGHSAEELHEIMKEMFLPRKLVAIGSREVEVRKSTTELSTDEFNLYLLRIEAWSSQEMGVTIPVHQ